MIMKPAFVLLASFVATLLSSSCNTDEQEKTKNVETVFKQVDTAIQKASGSLARLDRSISFLDSNLKYGRLAQETEAKIYKAEADYYRTQDEKYYRLFYKLKDKHNYYVGLNRKYYDSLQAQSKN